MAGAGSCPECRGGIEQINLKGVTVDRCLKCAGLWFDAGELTLSVEVLRPLSGFETAAPTDMSCMRCDVRLVDLTFPGTQQHVNACPRCKGTYLPMGRLEAIHRELEPIVGQLGKSPAGDRTAEILADLAKNAEGPSCPHCKKPFEGLVTKKGTQLEKCPACKSVWYDDAGKLTAELEVSRKISLKEGAQTGLPCPKCPKKTLVAVNYPKTDVRIEVCPDCRGSLVAENAFGELLKSVGRA